MDVLFALEGMAGKLVAVMAWVTSVAQPKLMADGRTRAFSRQPHALVAT